MIWDLPAGLADWKRENAIPAPPGWREIDAVSFAFQAFKSTDGSVSVMRSVDLIQGKRWLHVSLSRRSKMPSYEDMARVKEAFVGPLLPAYQVFPKKNEHRNLHNFALHLWAPLDGDPFPDPLGERADMVAP